MKTKTFEAIVTDDGKIEIPVEALLDMELTAGDSLEISYPCPTEPIEKCLRVESSYHEESNPDRYLCIPNELTEQCGMTEKKIHMICFNEEITITTSDKLCELVPDAIMNIFVSHGISSEEVAKGIAEASEIL